MSEVPKQNWFQENPLLACGIVFLLCFLFLEISCRILVSAGLLKRDIYPYTTRPVFWAYVDPVVGMWRYPNRTFNHELDCVDEVYTTNSVGARDVERSLTSDAGQRIVVLGDSVVEGLGSPNEDRMTNILEERTGIEHLNFGTSGGFGTIQEWLYYKAYASKYTHSDVFVFILPANDFTDNDVTKHANDLYRPYLRASKDTYEVFYPVEFEQRDQSIRNRWRVMFNGVGNDIYVFNAIRLAIHTLKGHLVSAADSDKPPRKHASTYDDHSEQDLSHMLFALDEIANLAGERSVYLFTVPTHRDANYAVAEGYQFKLVEELTAFANARDTVEYLDLLPSFLDYAAKKKITFHDFTLGCDLHWGRLGAEVAAGAVRDFVFAK
jgi:hypothetical protein